MIITRTPFRISFFGGGTDYPVWYKKNGGAVLSTTINHYGYITCRFSPPFFKHKYRVSYSKIEEVSHHNQIDHPSVRESLKFLNFNKNLSITYDTDLPARSGLGSSSSFTVGLLNALYGLRGESKTKEQLAMDAIHVEQNLIGENVGSQDQTAAAFGGLNKIEFGGANELTVIPIILEQKRSKNLQDHLLMFFTGYARTASEIAAEQIRLTPKKDTELHAMRQMVDEAVNILHRKKENLDDFGKLLHQSWQLKRSLSSKISNPAIDEIYALGIKAGAIGGKLLGAGGGGFMLFFAPPERHKKIIEKLNNFLCVPVNMEYTGSQRIYHSDF
ncbi:MAG: kinase [Candidatus Yanofskybacteria bacterium RIFCSPHIGHO2_01_FULL_42_12]|uniref:Kinase n=1 Tax=Candidatus Yanofskybacteria bacterium RIFCSPLOWO2_01_FULL_42_49 TaxID=1802694 RepID=A0A1F8GAZ7_9BACT|nr:MAG: kinase [Candidatus Yanofskybacteria bacterium RIFCSPHIGHO2_01_FULL_42_12]OGN22210.1 MAG: kinase [Candidatus Yanofskybacteria bacterium RIFCSPLOWO2_01_FULL_42_49]